GQWSVRGGIVDVFSPAQAAPARLEFFGDEIESIRLFDPTSQRSQATLDELLVLPLHDEGVDAGGRGLLDYLPPTAAVVVDSPKLLDATDAEAPERPPLAQRIAGRQRVELELVEGATGPAARAAASEVPAGLAQQCLHRPRGRRPRGPRGPRYRTVSRAQDDGGG